MFNYLNSILYKSTNNTDKNGINELQPYLLQRWCTMHSCPVSFIVNETTNKYWSVLDSNEMWYAALDTVIPKCNYKKINYIKKAKLDADKIEKEYIAKIANKLEISSREVISYIKQNNLTINHSKTND